MIMSHSFAVKLWLITLAYSSFLGSGLQMEMSV